MLCADGSSVYGFPSHAEHVLKVVPGKDEAFTIGDSLGPGRYKWGGGCNGADGAVYGIPSDTDTVLRIDPATDEVTTFGKEQLSMEKNKWQGAVSAPNGMIYGEL